MKWDRTLLYKLLWYYLGLFVVCIGYALVIKPGLGAAPWDIFHLGISGRTGVKLSLVIQLTGLVIILLNWRLAIRPSIGMVLNMLSVGPILTSILGVLQVPQTLAGRWVMLAAGILVAGFGTALYISADMGPGPRDGMMVGLTRRFGLPVGVIKNGIDVTVALLGWLLGGPLGVGTVFVALGLGPSVQLGMGLVARIAQIGPLSGFVRPVSLKRS
ncbi:MAG TPA: membrane protein [Symbiobacteriaceae bacterium]|nr:membrane protein [Symbiobacteriaceae bacterium]